MVNVLDQYVSDRVSLYNGDSVEVLKGLPDNCIHYAIFSPPFSSLYTYSNSDRDMGNSASDEQFNTHFKFLIRELARVIMPGRLVSVHCMDIPKMKSRDGVIGLKDFPGEIIRDFESAGFIYHSRVVVWKDPLVEATRTKALGLMHKQLCKDSSMCRNGLPDYVVTFRKPGDNPEPIPHDDGLKRFYGDDEPEGVKTLAPQPSQNRFTAIRYGDATHRPCGWTSGKATRSTRPQRGMKRTNGISARSSSTSSPAA